MPGKRSVKIKFRKSNSVIFRNKIRETFQSVYKCGGLRTGVWLNVTGNDINTMLLCRMGGFEHSIGFADSCGIAEKDFQMSAIETLLFLFNLL